MRTARKAEKSVNMITELAKAVIISLAVSFVLVVLYAVALKEELLATTTMTLFTTVIKVICAALAGLLAVRRCRRRLWLYGAAGGGLYTLLSFGVFSAVAGTLCVSLALLSDIGMGALAGLLSVMIMQMLK
ncbi:MAG: TIGR04086 family membrane protein [Clostridia bacterium]|nr:TIGR04086 family membrane protein [Clostridia bacterium]MBR4019372.1 TIGR04086 family membrane protein [Clostridia bacterium]